MKSKRKQGKIAQTPETEHAKLVTMLRAYEKILHPDVFNPLLKQISAVYEEAKKDAFRDAKISDEALEIEKIILDLKEKEAHDRLSSSFHYKIAYKQILAIFNSLFSKDREQNNSL